MSNNNKLVRVHMYISERDYDLLLLCQSHRLKEAIRQGVHKYLTDDALIMMPLPDYQVVEQEIKRPSIYFSPKEDMEVINFLTSIPKGNVNAVLQLLIRNVLRKADIRQYMDSKAEKKPRAKKPPEETLKVKAKEKKEQLSSTRDFVPDMPEFSFEDSDDNIFAEI